MVYVYNYIYHHITTIMNCSLSLFISSFLSSPPFYLSLSLSLSSPPKACVPVRVLSPSYTVTLLYWVPVTLPSIVPPPPWGVGLGVYT